MKSIHEQPKQEETKTEESVDEDELKFVREISRKK